VKLLAVADIFVFEWKLGFMMEIDFSKSAHGDAQDEDVL
jgi:hypothetical protein